MQEWACHNR